MGAGKPRQGQEPDDDHLTDDRIAEDQIGHRTAHDGGFDQFRQLHDIMILLRVSLRAFAQIASGLSSAESAARGADQLRSHFLPNQQVLRHG